MSFPTDNEPSRHSQHRRHPPGEPRRPRAHRHRRPAHRRLQRLAPGRRDAAAVTSRARAPSRSPGSTPRSRPRRRACSPTRARRRDRSIVVYGHGRDDAGRLAARLIDDGLPRERPRGRVRRVGGRRGQPGGQAPLPRAAGPRGLAERRARRDGRSRPSRAPTRCCSTSTSGSPRSTRTGTSRVRATSTRTGSSRRPTGTAGRPPSSTTPCARSGSPPTRRHRVRPGHRGRRQREVARAAGPARSRPRAPR